MVQHAGRRNFDVWSRGIPEPELGNAMHPANWDVPFLISPHDPQSIYAGMKHLFRSRDRGRTWEDLGDQTTGTDRRGDRRNTDRDDDGDADPRQHHGCRERKFHHPQTFTAGHSHRDRRFPDLRIYAQDPGYGVSNHRQKRVKRQGDDRGTCSDTADERDRYQQTKKREARNGLHNVRKTEYRWLE